MRAACGCLLGFMVLFLQQPLSADLNQEVDLPVEKKSRGIFREIRTGIMLHDVDFFWSNKNVENGIDYNLEILFSRPSFCLLSGMVFPGLGVTVNDRGNTSKIYGGFLWEWETRTGLFLDLGLGAAIHDGELNIPVPERKLLGKRVLFRIPVEIGFRMSTRFRLSLMFSHVSNGFTAEYNQGLDVLGVRCGYCF